MLELKICQDSGSCASLCASAGVRYTGTECIYRAADRGETLGYCVFRLSEDGLRLLALCDGGDAQLGDGLVKAAACYAADRGALSVEVENDETAARINRLGGYAVQTKCAQPLPLFLTKCKNCGGQNEGSCTLHGQRV